MFMPRRRGRHHYPDTPAPCQPRDLPRKFWPLLAYLEALALRVEMDPEYAARMAALNAEYRAWADEGQQE